MNEPFGLEVRLYKQVIGMLTYLEGDRSIFTFDPQYINNSTRPTLSLSFKNKTGGLITEHRAYQTRLMPFFSNLLPEGYLREFLASIAGIKSSREFHLLWALGKDLPGAVSIHPTGGKRWPPEGLHQGVYGEDLTARDSLLRFSLAGVQMKLSALLSTKQRLTIPSKGIGGNWIVKFPSPMFDALPENEFSMMVLAEKVGITVPQCKLINTQDITDLPKHANLRHSQAFAIERFDRAQDGSAIHIEDFAQIFNLYPEEKYKGANIRNIAYVLKSECRVEDIAEFTRRLIFNTLIGNADMHLKNWSLIYKNTLNASLSPAYDFVSTVPYLPDDKAALKISRSARFEDFDQEELQHLCQKAKLPQALVLSTAKETVQRFLTVWKSEKKHLPLSSHTIEKIEAHMARIPLINL